MEDIEEYLLVEERMSVLISTKEVQEWIYLLEKESKLFKQSWKVRRYVNTGEIHEGEADEWNPEFMKGHREEKLWKQFLNERNTS